ncbi:MAG: hypothetical protein NZZ41_02235 [Candidatus Dojkabacteria bacterium]|nr:hypothetical protein [Candidatus Dojkabacteria bacterium]
MVTIDLILKEFFDLTDFSYPMCFIEKSKPSKNSKPRYGWISIKGIEFNVYRFNKMDVLVYINYSRSYFLLDTYVRECFGFKLHIDNFVYGCLYSAIAAHLLSYQYQLPVFFGFCFYTYKAKSNTNKYPKRYLKGFRYAHKDLLVVGKLILEEWLKRKRKEKPSFMLEMSLN